MLGTDIHLLLKIWFCLCWGVKLLHFSVLLHALQFSCSSSRPIIIIGYIIVVCPWKRAHLLETSWFFFVCLIVGWLVVVVVVGCLFGFFYLFLFLLGFCGVFFVFCLFFCFFVCFFWFCLFVFWWVFFCFVFVFFVFLVCLFFNLEWFSSLAPVYLTHSQSALSWFMRMVFWKV